jgi:zinc protease
MPVSPITFPPSAATVFQLENGLEVILKEDHSAPLVSAQVWVRTGSILEADLLGTGVSHLVEHMVFQGAGTRGPGQLAHAVQETGGYLNAYTSFDRTVYWIDTLREGLDVSLGVLSDLTMAARFPHEEFEKEKDVIRREIDMGKDDPGRAVSQLMFRTVYREHPFREPVIGRLELFNTVERDAAFGYWQNRYIPNRSFLVIVGDFQTAEVKAKVEQIFAPWASRSAPPVHLPEEPAQTTRRDAHESFATELTKMELAWRIPGLLHEDTAALEVLGTLMGSGRTSRLWREVRERKGLVYGVGAGAYTPVQGGIFYMSAECDPDKRVAAGEAMLEQLSVIQEKGVTEQEVKRACRMFLSDQLQGLTSMRGMASDIGGNWHSAGNTDFTRDYLAAVDRVTPEQVQTVAQRYLKEGGLSSISINPEGTLAAERVHVSVSRPEEIKRHVFPNGLTLLVREDARLPLVSLHAALRGGVLAETAEDNGIGRLMARTMIKGTRTRSADDIADTIEDGGGSIGADSAGSSFSASVQVLKPDLRTGLELWADVLLRPVFPADEVSREIERQVAALKQQEDHPSFIAFRELRRAAYGGHPFALNREGTPESLASLTPEKLSAFHAAKVLSGNAVLSVFGDVSFEEVRDLCDAAFASMQPGARLESDSLPPVPPHSALTVNVEKDKKQAFLVAGFPTVPLTHPDRVVLDLIDEACSDMASRFFEAIREKHGLAYSVGATQVLGMCPGLFAFYLSTAPEKLDFAQAELVKEIHLLAADGLTEAEIDRARKTWIGKQAMQQQNSAGMAQVAALDELYGLGHNHSEQVLERVRSISFSEVRDVCARYFTGPPVVVRVAPAE